MLMKAMYGTKQANMSWYKEVDGTLKQHKLICSKVDPCLYYAITSDMILLLSLHVDDMLIAASTSTAYNELITFLRTKYELTEGDAEKFLGIRITQTDRSVFINQEQATLELLERMNMTNCSPNQTPWKEKVYLTQKDCSETPQKFPFRETVGSLLYLALCTRPDISAAVSHISRFCDKPGSKHVEFLKGIFRHLKGTLDLGIKYSKKINFPNLPVHISQNPLSLFGMSDSDWGWGEDRAPAIFSFWLEDQLGGDQNSNPQ